MESNFFSKSSKSEEAAPNGSGRGVTGGAAEPKGSGRGATGGAAEPNGSGRGVTGGGAEPKAVLGGGAAVEPNGSWKATDSEKVPVIVCKLHACTAKFKPQNLSGSKKSKAGFSLLDGRLVAKLNSIKERTIGLIGTPDVTNELLSLERRIKVTDLSTVYIYHEIRSNKLSRTIKPRAVRTFRYNTEEAQQARAIKLNKLLTKAVFSKSNSCGTRKAKFIAQAQEQKLLLGAPEAQVASLWVAEASAVEVELALAVLMSVWSFSSVLPGSILLAMDVSKGSEYASSSIDSPGVRTLTEMSLSMASRSTAVDTASTIEGLRGRVSKIIFVKEAICDWQIEL
nr:unnamed protein product [Callosobruchus chinensis]